MPTCSQCRVKKAGDQFYWKSPGKLKMTACIPCDRKRQAKWRAKNKDSAKKRSAEWYANNKEQHRLNGWRWRLKNPQSIKDSSKRRRPKIRAYRKKRYHENAEVRLLHVLGSRIRFAIKSQSVKKSKKTSELVGCSVENLKLHLESQFIEGMSWENYGPVWHVDHKRPCASFDLSDPDQQKKCFHFSNLQPLFAKDNFKKGARFG